jgi:hypothetical protein
LLRAHAGFRLAGIDGVLTKGVVIMGMVVLWCALSAIGGLIALVVNGRVLAGLVLGLLLGPIGWLLVFFLSDLRQRCPSCKGVVASDATACMHCGASLITRPLPQSSETFCQKCGVDGMSTMEFGRRVMRCPKCGAKL